MDTETTERDVVKSFFLMTVDVLDIIIPPFVPSTAQSILARSTSKLKDASPLFGIGFGILDPRQ
jgi:hypothetical protein